MVDINSSANILYKDTFQKLRLTTIDLLLMSSTLIRFTRDSIAPLGITILPVTLSQEPRSKTLMLELGKLGATHGSRDVAT
ncbi:hypothetical protein BHM03_00026022 [Ensete ventricosum]|nr:hypothetical protein BHM03_00026022 [Ensete ventricosum]